MSDTCETVKVASETAPGGYIAINKSDFDPAIHRLFESPPEGDQKPPEGDEPKPKGKK